MSACGFGAHRAAPKVYLLTDSRYQPLAGDYHLLVGVDAHQLKETREVILRALGIGIAVTILLAMPLLAMAAVFIGLWATATELNITAIMGMTMVVGIVTEVAIFYFSEYHTLVEEGVDRRDAVVQAGINRLRPIAMTTLAAILALLPLALGLGQGSAMQQPLAIAIISGLTVQLPLVLIVMPVLFKVVAGQEASVDRS